MLSPLSQPFEWVYLRCNQITENGWKSCWREFSCRRSRRGWVAPRRPGINKTTARPSPFLGPACLPAVISRLRDAGRRDAYPLYSSHRGRLTRRMYALDASAISCRARPHMVSPHELAQHDYRRDSLSVLRALYVTLSSQSFLLFLRDSYLLIRDNETYRFLRVIISVNVAVFSFLARVNKHNFYYCESWITFVSL